MSARARWRVLLVDDSEPIRQRVRALLAEVMPELAIEEAGAAEEALQRAHEDTFDVVVLDLHLPGVHGLDLLESLRTVRATLPVIVMTALAEPVYAVAARRLGAVGYISKSNLANELPSVLRLTLADAARSSSD